MSASLAKTHANYSGHWHTPPEWIAWVDETFQQRDWFDPCPATWDPSRDACGLTRRWGPKTYINHYGERGSTVPWWEKSVDEIVNGGIDLIWCAFNDEQERHMKPSPWKMPGWMVRPRERIGFIWGGPDMPAKSKGGKARVHGERATAPGNWTVFWSSVEPAPTPIPCVIVRTGV